MLAMLHQINKLRLPNRRTASGATSIAHRAAFPITVFTTPSQPCFSGIA